MWFILYFTHWQRGAFLLVQIEHLYCYPFALLEIRLNCMAKHLALAAEDLSFYCPDFSLLRANLK
jgi:hypothetical protein